jgi:7-cyano-7-deazaguanine synthase in queuosine biosynthesis
MSDDGIYDYRFIDDPQGEPPDGWQSTSDFFPERDDRITHLYELAGRTPPLWAQDFFRIARVVYLVDKLASRKKAPDGWTREITLAIQLANPEIWRPETLEKVLCTLTSDIWELNFDSGATPRQDVAQPLEVLPKASEIALFSGGLDSAAYAAHRAHQDGALVLVAHYTDDKGQQRSIFEEIPNRGKAVFLRQFHLQAIRVNSLQQSKRDNGLELSTRSRGLLFIAAAVLVAAAHNVPKVVIPENGQMALNPPLAANRVGACSTRSVHPTSLELINGLIRDVGGDVQVVNPFMTYTKAGVCSLARSSGLGVNALMKTVSCGRPPNRRRGGIYHHCGCCLPCLVRRAGLWVALNGHDKTPYEENPWNKKASSEDLIAVLHWLAVPFHPRDLVADMPLPATSSLTELTKVIEAGRQDMKLYLDAVLPAQSQYRRWLT